ncbi:MAG TPA: hypothetical protein IAA26_03310 [Candidatus Blautia faecipullorum]|nr:hypothetical protein [Candidatus Blautia faecipullorum]
MEYKREVLVPYLTELYGLAVITNTLGMKKRQLEQTIEQEKANINKTYKLNQTVSIPAKVPREVFSFLGIIPIFVGIIIPIIGAVVIFVNSGGFGRFLLNLIIGYFVYGFLIVVPICKMVEMVVNVCEQKNIHYRMKLQESVDLDKEKTTIRQSQQFLPQHQKMGKEVNDEFNFCAAMLSDALGLNIIPKQYRNLGSIAYLYEYFTTSQATNLDQVIQTMLLDDVRQRIQNIENQLSQIISNQQRIYSKLCDIQYTAEQISTQLADIEFSQKELLKESQKQTDELKMIKTSARISNYLFAGTYLKMSQYLH